ncbi:MAG TPA: PIN domain-containing protein [Acidobacteriota bacterium]|nr:PIN domain-containing protein [Acidobacteriota bacterium]
MEGIVHLDTHVVAWLYAGLLELIPAKVATVINENSLQICPMVALELQYLHETGRITVPADVILEDLDLRIGLRMDRLSFARVVRHSLEEKWTRDPFDRLIVSQAKLRHVTLLTRDRTIRKHYKNARW